MCDLVIRNTIVQSVIWTVDLENMPGGDIPPEREFGGTLFSSFGMRISSWQD
jgi:hypothetical protein